MEIIAQGAEAVVYLEKGSIVKERVKKSYRLPQIDERLRKFRTNRETKVLKKLREHGFTVPNVLENNENNKIVMQHIEGELVKNILEGSDYKKLGYRIGCKLAFMHESSVIHADLTTSNLMVFEDEIYFLDFGLSYFSDKTEDKAVDLHLLKQSLESKHHEVYGVVFEKVLEGYGGGKSSASVLRRLEKVEQRGRHKKK